MGTKHKGDKINYCKWCGASTSMEQMQIPDTPILEFLEQKIDEHGREEVWGENSDWSRLDLDSDFEAELLVYDELLSKTTLKTICESCIEEDERLYNKYYPEQDGEVEFFNDDF